jgi:ubiquinone biosynthesis protein UbiJ
MALFGGSKKDDGLDSLKPTARDVVRAIAKEEAEDAQVKKTVQVLETKQMIAEAIKADNVAEQIHEIKKDMAILAKKVEELQQKSPVPRA